MSDIFHISRTQLNMQNYFSEDDYAKTHCVYVNTDCKIKIIFIGYDEFINNHNSLDLKFDLSISEINNNKWSGKNPTKLDNFPVTDWEKYKSDRVEQGKGYQLALGNKNPLSI